MCVCLCIMYNAMIHLLVHDTESCIGRDGAIQSEVGDGWHVYPVPGQRHTYSIYLYAHTAPRQSPSYTCIPVVLRNHMRGGGRGREASVGMES